MENWGWLSRVKSYTIFFSSISLLARIWNNDFHCFSFGFSVFCVFFLVYVFPLYVFLATASPVWGFISPLGVLTTLFSFGDGTTWVFSSSFYVFFLGLACSSLVFCALVLLSLFSVFFVLFFPFLSLFFLFLVCVCGWVWWVLCFVWCVCLCCVVCCVVFSFFSSLCCLCVLYVWWFVCVCFLLLLVGLCCVDVLVGVFCLGMLCCCGFVLSPGLLWLVDFLGCFGGCGSFLIVLFCLVFCFLFVCSGCSFLFYCFWRCLCCFVGCCSTLFFYVVLFVF